MLHLSRTNARETTSSPAPEKFSGESSDCGGFLFQCSLVFNRSPRSFASDEAKITFILRLLTGRALRWAEARFPNCQQFGCTFNEFLSEFKMIFAAEVDQVLSLLQDFGPDQWLLAEEAEAVC
uniref:DUF4939 domain-containing protein n=1 Tax=Fundulus heteroclitus TaxID=8078 RepID=A0A3Q2SXC7_FUNHE